MTARRRRGGLLIRWCVTCEHFHGRLTNRCLGAYHCGCPEARR